MACTLRECLPCSLKFSQPRKPPPQHNAKYPSIILIRFSLWGDMGRLFAVFAKGLSLVDKVAMLMTLRQLRGTNFLTVQCLREQDWNLRVWDRERGTCWNEKQGMSEKDIFLILFLRTQSVERFSQSLQQPCVDCFQLSLCFDLFQSQARIVIGSGW